MRLDRFLCTAGLGSRSDVKKLIQKSRITADGVICKDPSFKIDENHTAVMFDGKPVIYKKNVYFMLNKPQGIISASRADLRNPDERCVVDLISEEKHRSLFPVGRLDRDTEGLLLITDDGVLAHSLLSPSKHVNKTYLVGLRRELSPEDITKLEAGVDIGDDTPTRPASVSEINKTSVYITIHEGRFHQVKRMFEAVGNEVLTLKRISMGSLTLDPELKPGEYRELTEDELTGLKSGSAG